MSLLKQILVCLVLVAAAAGGWYFYADARTADGTAASSGGPGGGAAGGRAERVPGLAGRGGGTNVIVSDVTVDTSGDSVRAIGTAKAAKSITVYPQVAGIVSELAFEPGRQVAEGDLLVHLDDAEQAVAVESAAVALAQARETLERSRTLAGSRTISSVQLSEAQTAADQAEIQLRTAEIALSRRTITAPFAGTTGLTDVSVGDYITSSTAITTLADLDDMIVGFEVPERWSGRVEVGTPLTATADGLPGRAFEGEVSAIDNRVDETTRTLRMEARLVNSSGIIKPGMAITVSMEFRSDERLAAPSLSVQWDRQGSYVWKVAEGEARRADVTILSRRAGAVIVQSEALAEGDMVVTEGVQRLREGSRVAVLDRSGEAEAVADAPAAAPQS